MSSPILTKMSECLEFMRRHEADQDAIEVMEEAFMYQHIAEDAFRLGLYVKSLEGPGGQGKDERPSHREEP